MKIEEIVEEISNKSQKQKQNNTLSFWGFVIFLISGILGLIASSLFFNFFSESFQNQTPKQELLKKN